MKILCIVQARMGSERLYGKVMKDLMGKSMIEYTLSRLKLSRYVDDIVLATTDKQEDKILVEYSLKKGYNVFCGDENNVLKRYKDASDKYKGDVIIRVTGDCPLIDSTIVDNVITYFLSNTYDYVRLDVPDTFIRGFDVEIFSKQTLDRVYDIVSNIEDNMYREHVTLYIYRHLEEFKIGFVKGTEYYKKNYRLCVDTLEDFEVVKNIYMHFNDMYVSARDIVDYLDNNRYILEINSNVHQK